MSQITTGIRSILSIPLFYELSQLIMGAHSTRKRIVKDIIRPNSGMKILDIGCGPASLLSYLPENIDYYGFDISQSYINQAKKKYKDRGTFFCKYLENADLQSLPKFDLILIIGTLHHVDDETAKTILSLAKNALKDDGRLLTIDPCFDESQNKIARFLIENDRGRCVRDFAGYRSLAEGVFNKISVLIKHKKWVPYTHCYLECQK